MAKFYGKIGFMETAETSPGVWEEVPTERYYFGDVLRNERRWEAAQTLNDGLNINNQISIVADPYAINHFQSMRYIEFMNSKWKIGTVEVKYPRLLLNIGGVYNGPTATTSD